MKSDINKFDREIANANAKLDILKIEINGNKLRIRVRRQDISINKTKFPATPDGLKATLAICKDIEADYYRDNFDPTLVKYGLAKIDAPKLTEVRHLPVSDNSEPNLLEIWESYKALKEHSVAPRTKETKWSVIDKWLSECPAECLLLSNADKLLAWLRTRHSDGGIKYPLQTLSASVNLVIKLGKPVKANTLLPLEFSLKLPPKKQIKAYSKAEIKIIIQAFKEGRFDKESSNVSSSYYAGLVEFRFLTGCRPSEAIALTWEDIKDNGNKCQIIFNKRVAGRKDRRIQLGTKNGVEARIFPCNRQLTEFIRSLPKIPNEHNLVFPSIKSKSFINQKDFNSDWWKPIVEKLVQLGEVKDYLPFYDQRHSFITHTVRQGIDIKTTSTISGNSVETIINSYLATNDDIELPEI